MGSSPHGELLSKAERGPGHRGHLESLPPSPAVSGEPQEPRGRAAAALRRVLHQPGCAALLLGLQAGGALRDAAAGGLRASDPVGVRATPSSRREAAWELGRVTAECPSSGSQKEFQE